MRELQKSIGLKIALPNGSLEENTRQLFKDANLAIRGESRKHDARVDNPLILRVTFMRPQHIPPLVAIGAYHLGICGADCVAEAGATVEPLAGLPYGRGESSGQARIVLVTAVDNPIQLVEDIPLDTLVLSEYPHITERFFTERQVGVEVRFSYGGTEAHVPRDYLYGVCLTDTGTSLAANGLKILATVFETSTVLIANKGIVVECRQEVTAIKHWLVGTLEARAVVFMVMNVMASKKEAVLKVLPALKQPTITQLADGQQFSIGTTVRKTEQNNVLTRALEAGATDVLIQPICQIVREW